jgi:hypothetical protein
VQEDKKNKPRAELDGGVYLATFMMPQKDKLKDEVINKHSKKFTQE